MDESNRGLYDQVKALEDSQKAAKAKAETDKAAAQDQLDTIEEINRALEDGFKDNSIDYSDIFEGLDSQYLQVFKSFSNLLDVQNDYNAALKDQQAEQAKLIVLRAKLRTLDKDSTEHQELEKKIAAQGVATEQQATQAKVAMYTSYAQSVGGILAGLADTQDQTSREGFETAKKMQLAAAVVNTAGAIMNALSTVQPYPAALAAAALAAAAGAAQISKIESTSFGSGGSAGGFNVPSGSSGGGGSTGYAQTTGTVLGDNDAASKSSDKVLDLLKSIHAKEYRELRSIAGSMEDLNKNITGLVSSIVRSTAGGGITEGLSLKGEQGFAQSINSLFTQGYAKANKIITDALGEELGTVANILSTSFGLEQTYGFLGGAFGGGTEIKVHQTGYDIAKITAQDLQDGVNAYVQEYARIEEHTKGGWFHSGHSSYSYKYQEANDDITNLFTQILSNLTSSVSTLAKGLGGVEAQTKAMAYTFDIGKIDLKGMDSEAISKALSAVISAQADLFTEAILGPLIKQYQKVDEGLMETASRLLVSKAIVVDSFNKIGKAYSAAEQSLMDAAEGSIAVTNAIVEAAGGVEAYQKTFENFFDLFFSDAEKQAYRAENLQGIFADLGEVLPATRDGYREMTAAADVSTQAGQKAYVQLLELSDQAGSYYDYLENLADSRFDLENKLMQLQGKETEALTLTRQRELDAMDGSLRPLQQRVWALEDEAKAEANLAEIAKQRRSMSIKILDLAGDKAGAEAASRDDELAALDPTLQPMQKRLWALEDLAAKESELVSKREDAEKALQSAYANQSEALTTSATKFKSLASSLKAFRESLLTGSSSPLSLAAKDAATAARFESIARRAKLGDEDALSALQGVSEDYLSVSRDSAKSAEDYYRTFGKVQRTLEAAEQVSTRHADIAQQQLDSLTEQTSVLTDINDSVLSVADAIAALDAAQNELDTLNDKKARDQAYYEAKAAQLNTIDTTGYINDTFLHNDGEPWTAAQAAAAIAMAGLTAEEHYNLWGKSEGIAAYASGGYHSGGLRLVGEHGPELEVTGPAHIYNAADTRAMLSGDNAEMVTELRALRAEVVNLRAETAATARNTNGMKRQIERWDGDGMPETRAV